MVEHDINYLKIDEFFPGDILAKKVGALSHSLVTLQGLEKIVAVKTASRDSAETFFVLLFDHDVSTKEWDPILDSLNEHVTGTGYFGSGRFHPDVQRTENFETKLKNDPRFKDAQVGTIWEKGRVAA